MFVFTDRVWDELEDAQDRLDNSNEQTTYNPPTLPAAETETEENIPLNSDNIVVDAIHQNSTTPQSTDEYTYKIIEDESRRANYSSLIGIKFKDIQENKNFVIHNICSCSHRCNEELFYMYYNIERYF